MYFVRLLVIFDALKLHSRMLNHINGSLDRYGDACEDTADAAEGSSLSGMLWSKGMGQMGKPTGVSGQGPRLSVGITNKLRIRALSLLGTSVTQRANYRVQVRHCNTTLHARLVGNLVVVTVHGNSLHCTLSR